VQFPRWGPTPPKVEEGDIMGKVFFPLRDRKDKDEEPKRRRISVVKTYLGYGYWLIHFSDGRPDELRINRKDCKIPISSAKKYDKEGYPFWDEEE